MRHIRMGDVLAIAGLLLTQGVHTSQAPPVAQSPAGGAATGRSPAFQFDPSWPKPLPHNWILGSVVGVAVDARDHIWVIHRPRTLTVEEKFATTNPPEAACCVPAPAVLEFDQAGTVVQAWGGPQPSFEWPAAEHTVHVDARDDVWIGGAGADDAHILKFTRTGRFLLQIGRQSRGRGSNDLENLGGPAGIDVDVADNEVYVADGYRNRRVIVFDATTGAYKRHWGAYGHRPDDEPSLAPANRGRGGAAYDPAAPPARQFGNPVHCVRLSRDGLVYVCDRSSDRLQVFRRDGTFVAETRVAPDTRGIGSVHDLGFSRDPHQQYLYVCDASNAKVWILRRQDLATIGSFGHGGHFAGGFTAAHSLAVDSRGSIYVGETLEGKRVQRFLQQ